MAWPTTEQALASLTPDAAQAVAALLQWAAGQGIPAQVTEATRDCERQAELYAQGRTTAGSVVAQVNGCKSWHVLGRAVDLYVGTWEPAAYERLGLQWESMGGNWGGRFGDHVHFEWHGGHTMAELCPGDGACQKRSMAGIMAGAGLAAMGVAVALWMIWRPGR
jgi:peptidoglycan L-alanyl-D-glutamate endopeptidase CwlK